MARSSRMAGAMRAPTEGNVAVGAGEGQRRRLAALAERHVHHAGLGPEVEQEPASALGEARRWRSPSPRA